MANSREIWTESCFNVVCLLGFASGLLQLFVLPRWSLLTTSSFGVAPDRTWKGVGQLNLKLRANDTRSVSFLIYCLPLGLLRIENQSVL